MSDFNRSEIAEKLSNTVTDKIKFAYTLGIPKCTVQQLKEQYNMDLLSPHNFYLKVLEHWEEQKGADAKLAALIDILYKNDFKSGAGSYTHLFVSIYKLQIITKLYYRHVVPSPNPK